MIAGELSIEEMQIADAYVAQTSPAILVPRAVPLDRLNEVGHRYLLGAGGLYLEFRREWCYGVMLIGPSSISLPFGEVKPTFKTEFGAPPAWLYGKFLKAARAAVPNETAAWFVWNQNERGDAAWRYVELQATSSDAAHITFNREVLRPGEHVVVDIHSHGRAGAFFSPVDNINDTELRDVKIAVVVGCVNETEPQSKQRICALGGYVNRGSCYEISAAA